MASRGMHSMRSMRRSMRISGAFRPSTTQRMCCGVLHSVSEKQAQAADGGGGACAGLVLFVLTLQQGQYSYQFRQLAWSHLIVFFVVLPTSFLVPLAFEGLMWFYLPCGLVIVNDIMAYLAGALHPRPSPPTATPSGHLAAVPAAVQPETLQSASACPGSCQRLRARALLGCAT